MFVLSAAVVLIVLLLVAVVAGHAYFPTESGEPGTLDP